MIKDNYIYKKIGYILNKNIKRIRFTNLEIILSILTSFLKPNDPIIPTYHQSNLVQSFKSDSC